MTESGRMSENQSACSMRLLNLVTGMDAATRHMEKTCFAVNNKISKLMQQIGTIETNQMFTEEVSPYRKGSLTDYAAGSIGSERNRKTATGYAVLPEKQNKEIKRNRDGLENPVKVVTFFEDNRNFMLSNVQSIAAVTGMLTTTPDIFIETRATETKKIDRQNQDLVAAAGGFDAFSYGFGDFAPNGKYRADYGAGIGLYPDGSGETSGWSGKTTMVKDNHAATAVKAVDEEDIRWMRKLADRETVVQLAHHTLAPNIKVEFSGPITKEADVDEVILHLGAMMREQIAAAPEGVYG